jgi:uncharacterized membrane protein
MSRDVVIRIPKKAIQLVVGLFLIGLALLFIGITLANYSAFQNPLNFLMIGGLLGFLGIVCIFWKF